MVPPSIDKEGGVTRVLARAEAWQESHEGAAEHELWKVGLEILETMANLLEAGEAVSMNDPPSIRVLELHNQGLGSLGLISDRVTDWGAVLVKYVNVPARRSDEE